MSRLMERGKIELVVFFSPLSVPTSEQVNLLTPHHYSSSTNVRVNAHTASYVLGLEPPKKQKPAA